MLSQSESKIGAICAISGSGFLFVGTALHPMDADPNDAVAAFTEYVADHLWVASHLTQLAGVALMTAALVILAHQLESMSNAVWARLAAGGAIATLAVAIMLQAVDGIALKVMVDTWAAAPATQKEAIFQSAFAVRQIEVGFAAMLSLISGLTMILYGTALRIDHTYPKWLAGLAVGGGIPTMIAGMIMAYTGFSGLAMMISMPANILLLLWMFALGVTMWRRDESQALGERRR